MVRIPSERGAGARLELRLGDASANPYLLIAGTIAAALLGVRAGEEPPAPLGGYGYDTARAAMLPTSLPAALDALEADTALAEVLGKDFTTSYLSYKRNEVELFGNLLARTEIRIMFEELIPRRRTSSWPGTSRGYGPTSSTASRSCPSR